MSPDAAAAVPDTTLRVVEAAAEAWPEAEAIVDGDVRITFERLRQLVDASGAAAMAAGIEPGDRAAIWAPNRWDWIVAALGVQRAGGVIVPMTTRYKGDEAAYLLERSGARLLFTVKGFLGVDYPALLEGRSHPVERMVILGTDSWDEYLAGGAAAAGGAVAGRVADTEPKTKFPDVSGADTSDIIFTSGTTGRPKGVVAQHGQTVRIPRSWASAVGLRAGDRYLLVSPFSHASGYKAGFIGAFLTGATVYPMAVADTDAIMELVSWERISMFPGTPTMFLSMLNHPQRDRYDLSSLRLSAVGAASVPVELVRRMKDELFDTVITGYGLTETMGVATMSRYDDPPEIISRTVGRALPDVEIRIVDTAEQDAEGHGKEVPTGEAGEVLIRGYNVMQCYFDAPQQSAEAVDADGWLHTGDVGTLDADGYLAITDRLKDMFIVGGFNAYPAEIEATMIRHPAVGMVAVIGIPDERLGEVGMAFVVPKAGAAPTEPELVAWCRDEMANYKVPRKVAIVDELPLNSVGKIMKPELRAIAAERLHRLGN